MAVEPDNMLKKQLLIHDIHVNGLKALVYCFGLSASRYIEYSQTLVFLLPGAKQGDLILELGCGYSILPTFWQKLGMETIILDLNRNALKWQIIKSKKVTNATPMAIFADMQYIPIRSASINKISCISTIEHIPGKTGDVTAAIEIGRILKTSGICVISFPLSSRSQSCIENQWTLGIPPLMQRIFKRCLPAILKALHVDRSKSYCERFFSKQDVCKRIIKPLKCVREDYITLRSGAFLKLVYKKIIPTGVLTIFEYFAAKFLKTSKQMRNADAIVLKLKKL